MDNSASVNKNGIIVKAWLIAGTLDICCAMAWSYIVSGHNPLNVLAFVGRFALGKEVLSSGILNNFTAMCFIGLVVHYAIAFIWTLIFFYAWPKAKFLQQHPFLVAIIYGTFIWIVMNLAVL